MADEPIVTPTPTSATPQPPDGFRLVSEDDFKRFASAGNDLKKFKAMVPEGLDLAELPDILAENEKYRAAQKSQMELLEGQIEKVRTENKKLKDQSAELAEGMRRTAINNAAITKITEQAQESGDYLAIEFVDRETLYKLDPASATFDEEINKVLKTGYDRQNAFLQRANVKPTNTSPRMGHGPALSPGPPRDAQKIAHDLLMTPGPIQGWRVNIPPTGG